MPEVIYEIFEDPQASATSFFMSIFILIVIVVSSLCFILQTEPKWRYPVWSTDQASIPLSFVVIETFSMFVFLVEYLTRLCMTPFISWDVLEVVRKVVEKKSCLPVWLRKPWVWSKRPMNMIDFVAIAPYFLLLVTGQDGDGGGGQFGFLRILRLARVFRIFKIGKYSEGLSLYGGMIKTSISALSLLFFFSLLNA